MVVSGFTNENGLPRRRDRFKKNLEKRPTDNLNIRFRRAPPPKKSEKNRLTRTTVVVSHRLRIYFDERENSC